jgi:hypothetical protein
VNDVAPALPFIPTRRALRACRESVPANAELQKFVSLQPVWTTPLNAWMWLSKELDRSTHWVQVRGATNKWPIGASTPTGQELLITGAPGTVKESITTLLARQRERGRLLS